MRTHAIDFVVTDYLQRVEAFATAARAVGADVRAALDTTALYEGAVFVPICGEAVQRHGTAGFAPDGFMYKRGEFQFFALRDLQCAAVTGWLPPEHAGPVEVQASFEDITRSVEADPGALFSLDLPIAIPRSTQGTIRLELSATFQPSSLPDGGSDNRHLGCLLQSIRFY